MLQAFKQFLSELAVGEKDRPLRGQRLSPRGGGAAGPCRHDRRRMSDVERNKLHAVIKRRFDLDEAAANELVAAATEAERRRSISTASPACSTARSTRTAAGRSSR